MLPFYISTVPLILHHLLHYSQALDLLPHLKNIELEIIRLVRRPEDGVVAALGAEIDLAEAFMGAVAAHSGR